VILPPQLTVEKIRQRFQWAKYGVAYGKDMIPHAVATRTQFIKQAHCMFDKAFASVKHFVYRTQQWDAFFT